MGQADKRIRIMLVDDHKTLLWGLGKLIESDALNMLVVGTARDCDSALAMAPEVLPDVILLDIDLGGTCSLDIMPRLLAGCNGARVLVLSGTRDRELLDRAVMLGARGVVSKDEPADIVLKAIEKVYGGELWLDGIMLSRVFEAMRNPQARRQDPELDKISQLTAKERRICSLIATGGGAVNKALAQQLFISEHTLRNHLTAIYHKLGVSNRLDLYVFATKHRLDQADL